MQKVDANIVLRYLMEDHAELSPKAKNIIDNSTVEVPVETLCEVVFVLAGHYQVPRLVISAKLQEFFTDTQCEVSHRQAVLQGIAYYGQTTFDFVDCILAGDAEHEHDEIYTFDAKLQKFIGALYRTASLADKDSFTKDHV